MQRDEGGSRTIVFLVAVLFFNLLLMSGRIILKDDRSLLMTVVGFVVTPVEVAFQETVNFFSRNLRRYVFVTNNFQRYRLLRKEYSRLKYENYLLRQRVEALDFRQRNLTDPSRIAAAQLVLVDPNFPYNTILVDRGSLHGIRSGMVAINEDGDLVGRIIEPVQLFASRVRLITSARGGVGAVIERDRMEGLVIGENSRICSFRYLMEDLAVREGDMVVTSGTDGLFPPGLPLGKVVSVRQAQLTQDVKVRPHFIAKPMKRLMIIKNATQD